MKMTFERVRDEDGPEFQQAQSWVYAGEGLHDAASPKEEGEGRFCVRADGKIVSVCQVWPLQLLVAGEVMPTGGVAGVGTLVEARQTGAGTMLMQGVLRAMREDGMLLSALYGFREPYYSQFDYASCGWRWQITAPTHRIPRRKFDLPVRRIDPKDVMELDGCYRAFIEGLSGCHIRTAEDWKDRLGKTPPAIYAIGGPVEAYFWTKTAGFWEELELGEVAWSTRRGYDALLTVARGLAANHNSVTWCEPPASPFRSLHWDQGVKAVPHRPTMFRVVNVPDSLAKLSLVRPGSVAVQVHDSLLPENSGVWRAEGGSCSKGGQPDVTISVSGLAQAIMGSPSIQDLVQWGEATVHNSEAVQRIETFFGSRQVVCMEFF